jgi:hypothetical protein
MKNKFLKLTTLPLVSTVVLTPIIATSITQCSKNEQNIDPTNYIGNQDGSNWKGYKGGDLLVSVNANGAGVISGAATYEATNLIIPDKVELENGEVVEINEIGFQAFLNSVGTINSLLKGKITLPNNLTKIGDYAFGWCGQLQGHLTIPDSVENIGNYAFSGCKKITSVSLSNKLKQINDNTFSGCIGIIGELIIPDSITKIGDNGFYGCNSITSIKLSSPLKIIANDAFRDCSNLSKITLVGFDSIGS